MTKSIGGFIIFSVDDAHFMDLESWEFVSDLGQDMSSLVLITLKTSSKYYHHPAALQVLKQTTTMSMELTSMDTMYVGSLACQLLGVSAIPKRLER